MNNVNSYGSFKTLKSVFCYSACAAKALQKGGIPWVMGSIQMHMMHWCALGGVVLCHRGPAVVTVEFFPFGVSV